MAFDPQSLFGKPVEEESPDVPVQVQGGFNPSSLFSDAPSDQKTHYLLKTYSPNPQNKLMIQR